MFFPFHMAIINGHPVSMIFKIQGKVLAHHTEAIYTNFRTRHCEWFLLRCKR